MSRENFIKVSLTDQELARLDELRGNAERAVHLRRLLHEPPSGSEIATHSEALEILTTLARDGRTTAAIALEKATRTEGAPAGGLEAFLNG